jgi:hypothetical protein
MSYSGQSKLAAKYLAASQIAPLFKMLAVKNSPPNMWWTVKTCR